LQITELAPNLKMPPGYWDFGNERELKWHRIHAYPAKFPAFITGKAVEHARSKGVEVNKVADIFCGCGTTAFEARRLNLDFWGCDVNPVATLIASVKGETYQSARLERYFSEIEAEFTNSGKTAAIEFENKRIQYWFSESQSNELSAIKQSVETLLNGKYRDFFLCAFSNILKPASRWLTKSIKPQIDPTKKPQKPWHLFEQQVNLMLTALNEIKVPSRKSEIDIQTTNFFEADLKQGSVDLIVTSPPYVTSYEYADLHQLSTLWLGFADDYRDLRKGTVGSLYKDFDFNADVKTLCSLGSKMVFRLYNIDKRKAAATARYFKDLEATVHRCKSVLRKGGMLFFVIGDTEYKDVRVENSKLLAACLKASGFTEISCTKRKISRKILTPYRDAKGCFSTKSTDRKVYAEEFVISAIK